MSARPEAASRAAARAVVDALRKSGKTLAVAESCTGGLIGDAVTNVPGSSAVFLGSAVTYANSAKTALLGVDPASLAAHGAVSEPVARQMAAGARARFGSDVAVATSGVAGPGGGTPDKPVGTLCLALSAPGVDRAWTVHFASHSRRAFKHAAAAEALNAVRAWLQGP